MTTEKEPQGDGGEAGAAMDRLERIAETLDRRNEKQHDLDGRSVDGDRHASADRVQKTTRQRSLHL